MILGACGNDKKNTAYLPKATGKSGDILLVMDSVQWRGELGKAVRKILEAEVPGLPQGEPMFKVIWIHPSRGTTMLNRIRNIVYVFSLDQKTTGSRILQADFSPETIQKIKSDTSFYVSTRRDEYAIGQEVMYLFGDTQANLIRHLQQHADQIVDHFNDIERKRMESDVLGTRSTQGLTAFLRKEQQCEIHVPFGYRLADKQADFVWFRFITADIDKDLFISWKPYTSEYQMLPDSLIAWRNAIAKRYLFEDPANPESYLVTEREDARVQARQKSINGHYAMQLRGLWRTNTRSMGGPFVGYAIIDESMGRLYYIEGFAYAPGQNKREMMRELDVVLHTFRTSDAITTETKAAPAPKP